MITIENKKTSIKDADGREIDYKVLITTLINTVPFQGGFTRDELAARDRLEKVVNNPNEAGNFVFEDADFKKLKEINDNKLWQFRHADLTEFVDMIAETKIK